MDSSGLDALKAAGFTWLRGGMVWQDNETSKGRYNFGPWDTFQAAADARGMKPLWLLAYGNSLYGGLPTTTAGRQAFVNWAVALVNHLPKGAHWEIWNEPKGFGPLTSSQFASLCDAVAQAIHNADPTAKVTAGGLAWFDTWFEDRMLTAGAGAHVDALSVHMYMYNHSGGQVVADPELVLNGNDPNQARLPNWDQVKASYGLSNLPNWNTEGGYCTDDSPNSDSSWQSRMTVRWILSAWAAGFEKIILYDKSDGCYGILNTSLANTYKAIKTLSLQAADRTFTGYSIASTDATKLNLFRMESVSHIVYVLWMRSGTYMVAVPAGTQGVDMLGNSFTTGSSQVVDAAKGPIYLKFSK